MPRVLTRPQGMAVRLALCVRPSRAYKVIFTLTMCAIAFVALNQTRTSMKVHTVVNGRVFKYVPESSLLPVVKETPHDVRLVMLLSYQRSGSTYIGRMFNDTGQTFFLYEPLDALYTAMYGTMAGWNVPDDIFNFPNGSMRPIPQDEVNAIRWTLEQILTCNMSSLPPAILGHVFWAAFVREQPVAGAYNKCLKTNGARHISACHRGLKSTCGSRFGEHLQRQESVCKKYLWGHGLSMDNYVPLALKYMDKWNLNPGLPKALTVYMKCITKWSAVDRACAADVLDRACRGATVRAVKTVRATMAVPEYLLKKYDNFFLLHSFRDPRGAVLSRSRSKWSRGLYGKNNEMAQEAHIYCANVLQDNAMRRELEEKFPQRVRSIVYDDFVGAPLDTTANIYRFLNTSIPRDVKAAFADHHLRREASQVKANNWQKMLAPDDLRQVNAQCQEFFRSVNVRQWLLTHISNVTARNSTT